MGMQWNRFGVLVCALVGVLCLTPALAATSQHAGHVARTPAKAATKHAAVGSKAQRAKPHATAHAARKAGKPHAAGTAARRPVPHASGGRAQRKSVVAQRSSTRHAVGKKPVRTPSVRKAKPGTKLHGTVPGKRAPRKVHTVH